MPRSVHPDRFPGVLQLARSKTLRAPGYECGAWRRTGRWHYVRSLNSGAAIFFRVSAKKLRRPVNVHVSAQVFSPRRCSARPLRHYLRMSAIPQEIEQALAAYYARCATIRLTPTDFAEWLRTLPPPEQAFFAAAGFPACCAEQRFQRYCLEWRGFSLPEHMALHLSYNAYCYWAGHIPHEESRFAT